MRASLLVLAVLLTAGCAPDLRDEYPFDGALPPGERITHDDLGGGVTRTVVDASHKEAWVYFDVDARAELEAAKAFETQAWDLAFQRYKIITNSGVSGPGEVGVAPLSGQDFDALVTAPKEGYATDAPDGADGNSDVDSAFLAGDGWYLYDLGKHKLSPRDIVYVVRTGEGRFFKLQLEGYYDAAGTAGVLTFRWAELPAP